MKSNLLFNPFVKIAGLKSLFFGVLGMLFAGFIGYYSQTHFDGVLNIHSGYQGSRLMHLVWPFADVLFISIWFWLAAFIFSRSKFRIIDILGTQAFSFLPLVPATFLGFYKGTERLAESMKDFDPKTFSPELLPVDDLMGVIAIALVVLFLTALSGIWMYNGFKISANLSHKIVAPVFIVGVLTGMFIPKFIIHHLFM